MKSSEEYLMVKSELELAFETFWIQCGGDIDRLQDEFKFHPKRKWRFDYAHPTTFTAIELEGGTWGKGEECGYCGQREQLGHSTGKGYAKDCEKYNAAALLGWAVFRFTIDMLTNDPWGHLRPVVERIEHGNRTQIIPHIFPMQTDFYTNVDEIEQF